MPNDKWENNSIQFPRLLAELQGLLTFDQLSSVAESMDLEEKQVEELLNRAITEWEGIKSDMHWDAMERAQAEHDAGFDVGNPKHARLEDLIKEYGPIIPIDRARADELCGTGGAGRVLCLHRTNDEGVLYGTIGFHIVDVEGRYELAKPAPTDLDVFGCDEVDLYELCEVAS